GPGVDYQPGAHEERRLAPAATADDAAGEPAARAADVGPGGPGRFADLVRNRVLRLPASLGPGRVSADRQCHGCPGGDRPAAVLPTPGRSAPGGVCVPHPRTPGT